MRKINFVEGEFYHIYNRGVDKRKIFSDKYDLKRFFKSMSEFNTIKPIGSIFENSFRRKREGTRDRQLIQFVAYCINPNHFHFILSEKEKDGIKKFMQRLGTGYTMYFNEKYKRSGALFQGRFKSNHIDSNEYLLHASAYVNLNNLIHKYNKNDFVMSSWNEYVNNEYKFCTKEIVLGQFKNRLKYKKFAQDSLRDSIKRKEILKELEQTN